MTIQIERRTFPGTFSVVLLQGASGGIIVIELLEDILWCDWGCPERITQTLRLLGKEPAFPTDMFNGSQSRWVQLSREMKTTEVA